MRCRALGAGLPAEESPGSVSASVWPEASDPHWAGRSAWGPCSMAALAPGTHGAPRRLAGGIPSPLQVLLLISELKKKMEEMLQEYLL